MLLIKDVPKEYETEDSQYIRVMGIKTFLEDEEHQEFLTSNNLIALYGEWGSGKSSVFKTLESKIDTLKYKPLIFETWKYEKDDNLAFSLLDFIFYKIVPREKYEEISNRCIWKILKQFSKGVTVKVPFIADINLKNTLENKKTLYKITEDFLKEFQEIINQYTMTGPEIYEKKILVMIDDLDRCEDENIINLLSALKLLFAIKNAVFICGVDKQAVIKTLNRKYNDLEKAKEYLDKIFSINFSIMKTSNLKLFDKEKDRYLANIQQKIIETIGVTNPRKLNQVINKYIFLRKIIKRQDFFKNLEFRDFIGNEIFKVSETDSNFQNKIYAYLNRIINFYLFIRVILFEFYQKKDIEILKKYDLFNYVQFFDRLVLCSDNVNFSNDNHLELLMILKAIEGMLFSDEYMEILWDKDIINYYNLEKFIGEELEKYY